MASLWRFPAERFTSQAFWDYFDRIRTGGADDELDQAQALLLGAWYDKQRVSRRLLAYDTTNFHTYVATTNARNRLAQRGHSKQGRHNLRQVGLSYVLDSDNGLGLCHHVYPGNVADTDELPAALDRIVALLDRNRIDRGSVTLVLDKGSAALANTVELQQAGVGWISALPWNQAPTELRARDVTQLVPCQGLPGIRAAAETHLVHGQRYLCVLKYPASFAAEQMQSLTTSLAKAMQNMRRLTLELAKPKARFEERGVRNKIAGWLAPDFLAEVVRYDLQFADGRSQLQFDFDHQAWLSLIAHRLGRTVLLTNRMDWTAEQVLRGLKDGDWLGWGPMHHWTGGKIRIHAFYCLLGMSLLQSLHRKSQSVWPGLSIESLRSELDQVKQFVLLYPTLGDTGPHRTATVLSKQMLAQQGHADAIGLDQLLADSRA